jgi:hypothetical protein
MHDVLTETLADVAKQAAHLAKQAAGFNGQLSGLVAAQLVVAADEIRSELHRIATGDTEAEARQMARMRI